VRVLRIPCPQEGGENVLAYHYNTIVVHFYALVVVYITWLKFPENILLSSQKLCNRTSGKGIPYRKISENGRAAAWRKEYSIGLDTMSAMQRDVVQNLIRLSRKPRTTEEFITLELQRLDL
jgi:hypothetical protein